MTILFRQSWLSGSGYNGVLDITLTTEAVVIGLVLGKTILHTVPVSSIDDVTIDKYLFTPRITLCYRRHDHTRAWFSFGTNQVDIWRKKFLECGIRVIDKRGQGEH